MYNYEIYGLRISSSRKVDLLKEQETCPAADLTVNWRISTSQTPDNSYKWKQVHSETLKLYTVISLWETEIKAGNFTKVCFELEDQRVLNFVVDADKENLWIYHHEEEPKNDLESYLVGPALGFIMRMRGIICLHSSAVEIDGKAIALVGCSTAGKSTTAAGLAAAGARILADDISVLIPQNDEFVVQPGYSKVRLRAVAAQYLTENPKDLPIVYSYRDSRYVSLKENENFYPKPLPLSSIYVLGEVSDEYKTPFIQPINFRNKLITLLANTYGSYVVLDKLRENEFSVLANAAKTIPMRKLFYAHDIKTLPAQCSLIIKDFREIVRHQNSIGEHR